MKTYKGPNTPKAAQKINIVNTSRSISPNKKTQYSHVSPRYLQPRSPKKNNEITNLRNSQVKTVRIQQIKQIAQKHYNKAMKYVYKKNNQHKQMKQREINKLRPDIEKITSQHTFRPLIKNNKYNKRIEQIKSKNEKHLQLHKWGKNRQTIKRQQIIKQQANVIRKTVEKTFRSLENSRNVSLSRSFEKSLDKSVSMTNNSKQAVTNQIPGVKKYYLNQIRAKVAKTGNQRFMFRGNDASGYYY